MNLLLDTHACLWFMEGSDRLHGARDATALKGRSIRWDRSQVPTIARF
jgi:PIN domain nuclease of toxin-antitoxin system